MVINVLEQVHLIGHVLRMMVKTVILGQPQLRLEQMPQTLVLNCLIQRTIQHILFQPHQVHPVEKARKVAVAAAAVAAAVLATGDLIQTICANLVAVAAVKVVKVAAAAKVVKAAMAAVRHSDYIYTEIQHQPLRIY